MRSFVIIIHFTPQWLICSTNDSSEHSIRIFWILWIFLGCVKLHNDSSYSTM